MERGQSYALRLDVGKALALTGPLTWIDLRGGEIVARPERLGDVVIARKDIPTSYHLAVTIDDYMQEISLVTRGEDLFEATHIHRLIQSLLGLKSPHYYHHNLLADRAGNRLSKRNRAVTLRHLRDSRKTPDQIWDMLGLREYAAA
jgi:glutamyl-Q tRNA(Asp) synthetase